MKVSALLSILLFLSAGINSSPASTSKTSLQPLYSTNGPQYFDFGKHYSKTIKNITIPLNINPIGEVTLYCRAKLSFSMQRMYVLGNGTDKRNRCIIAEYHDEQFRWGLLCGKDGILWGPAVIDEWTCVAALYDTRNQEARLVVNNTVYAQRSTAGGGEENLFVGAITGSVDQIRIYDRLLSKTELEELSGIAITENPDALEIKDNYSFREKRELAEENKVKEGDVFIVDVKELEIRSRNDESASVVTILTVGDSLKVLEKLENRWYSVTTGDGKTGFLRRSAILSHTYPRGANVTAFRAKQMLTNLLDLRRLNSWLIIAVLAVIVVLAAINFRRLDNLLLKIRFNHDKFADQGSKNSSAKPKRQNFLHRIYPVKRWPSYPLLSGVLLGATIVIGAFWDAYEMEWFFNEGYNILPLGYDRPIHWFLYISCLLNLLLILSWIIESFVIAGPVVGLLRIILISILNFMTFLVTFCLILLAAAIIIGLMVLKGLASSGRRRVYYYD